MTSTTDLGGNTRMSECLAAAERLGFTERGYAGNLAHTSGCAQIQITDNETSVRVHLFEHRGPLRRHPIATGHIDLDCVSPTLFANVLEAVIADGGDAVPEEPYVREFGPQS